MTDKHQYLVALSGGADSVALLLYLIERGEAAAAAHCNFALRGAESDRDESFVRQLCEKRGVRLHVTRFDTQAEARAHHESIEMAARRLRYAWFAELCQHEGYEAVAVAHHSEDNAETILLNLIRGTGLKGLTGMRSEQPGIVRPLLSWTRSDIEHFLAVRRQAYVTDSTNDDTNYKRNAIRHKLLPLMAELNPRIISTLNEMARHLSEAEAIYKDKLVTLTKDITLERGKGKDIDVAKLLAQPFAKTLLHEWLTPYGFTPDQQVKALTMHNGSLLSAGDWLLTRTSTRLQLRRRPPVVRVMIPQGDGYRFYKRGYSICLCAMHIPRDELFLYEGQFAEEQDGLFIDYAKVKGQLVLRSVAAGDRFRPSASKGSKLVNDYLTQQGCSRIDKLAALVVSDDEGIVMVVGRDVDLRVKPTRKTKDYYLIFNEQ